jgi:DUF4097 and DUF4098 domain-containing protein YvlB
MKRTRSIFAAAAALLLFATIAAADTVGEKLDKTYPFQGGTVALDNVNGSVDVIVWDRPEVRVEAEKRVRVSDRSDAAAALKAVRIEIDESGSGLTIRTRYPNHKENVTDILNLFANDRVEAQVRYRLTVPRTAKVNIDTVNAGITVAGVQGGFELETVNGSIDVSGGAGSFEASTVNGSIDAELSNVTSGRVAAETVNGRVRLALPASLRADVDISTVNGKISSDIPVTARVMSRRNWKGAMNGGGGVVLAVSTVNGSVTIEPHGAAAK